MAVAVDTLLERIRSLVDDYGLNNTTLNGAISDTSTTSVTLTDAGDVSAGDFFTVDGETFEVLSIVGSTATVVRGAKGSTAATHSDGATVRNNLDMPPVQIVEALNLAQSTAYPQLCAVVSDTSLSIVSGQFTYSVPSGIDHVRQVWLETSTSDVYNMTRSWDMDSSSTIRLYGENAAGRLIKVVGLARFDDMAYGGDIDTDFPTGDKAATGYLVYAAAATLIEDRQIPIAKRDGFVGMTDDFQESQPYMSIRTATYYRKRAEDLLADATRNLVLPQEVLPDPARVYRVRT